ncbi:hypothetical protein NKH18_43815 [Streptomyces sp. M10(2022)]
MNRRILTLAETLLEDDDIQISGAEAWAKYAGASDYDQDLHRDHPGHTLLVPSTAPGFRQLEMFVYLADVPESSARRTLSRGSTLPTSPPCPPSTCGPAWKARTASRTPAEARICTKRRCPQQVLPGQWPPSRSAPSIAEQQ